jgi:hypothetical protein
MKLKEDRKKKRLSVLPSEEVNLIEFHELNKLNIQESGIEKIKRRGSLERE